MNNHKFLQNPKTTQLIESKKSKLALAFFIRIRLLKGFDQITNENQMRCAIGTRQAHVIPLANCSK